MAFCAVLLLRQALIALVVSRRLALAKAIGTPFLHKAFVRRAEASGLERQV